MEYKGFLQENALKAETEKYIASIRFLDDNGQPMEWELRSISAKEDEDILKSCLKVGARGLELDKVKCLGLVVASSVVYPNLDSVELQDSYGVKSREQLLRVMLTAREYYLLQRQIGLLGSNKETVVKSEVSVKDETVEGILSE